MTSHSFFPCFSLESLTKYLLPGALLRYKSCKGCWWVWEKSSKSSKDFFSLSNILLLASHVKAGINIVSVSDVESKYKKYFLGCCWCCFEGSEAKVFDNMGACVSTRRQGCVGRRLSSSKKKTRKRRRVGLNEKSFFSVVIGQG